MKNRKGLTPIVVALITTLVLVAAPIPAHAGRKKECSVNLNTGDTTCTSTFVSKGGHGREIVYTHTTHTRGDGSGGWEMWTRTNAALGRFWQKVVFWFTGGGGGKG